MCWRYLLKKSLLSASIPIIIVYGQRIPYNAFTNMCVIRTKKKNNQPREWKSKSKKAKNKQENKTLILGRSLWARCRCRTLLLYAHCVSSHFFFAIYVHKNSFLFMFNWKRPVQIWKTHYFKIINSA